MSRLVATLRISSTWLVSSSAVIVGDTWGQTWGEAAVGGGRMGPGHRLRQEAMSRHPSSARPSSGTHLQGDAAVGQLLLQVHLDDEVPSLRELWERGGFGAMMARVLCTSPLPRGWGWHPGELELGFGLKVMDDGETRGGKVLPQMSGLTTGRCGTAGTQSMQRGASPSIPPAQGPAVLKVSASLVPGCPSRW